MVKQYEIITLNGKFYLITTGHAMLIGFNIICDSYEQAVNLQIKLSEGKINEPSIENKSDYYEFVHFAGNIPTPIFKLKYIN